MTQTQNRQQNVSINSVASLSADSRCVPIWSSKQNVRYSRNCSNVQEVGGKHLAHEVPGNWKGVSYAGPVQHKATSQISFAGLVLDRNELIFVLEYVFCSPASASSWLSKHNTHISHLL